MPNGQVICKRVSKCSWFSLLDLAQLECPSMSSTRVLKDGNPSDGVVCLCVDRTISPNTYMSPSRP